MLGKGAMPDSSSAQATPESQSAPGTPAPPADPDAERRNALEAAAIQKAGLGRIARFRNKHQGQSCVIVGNGPSLNQTDLERLRGLPSFGLNKINLLFHRSSFRPTYWVSVNPYVIEQMFDHLHELNCPKFIDLNGWRRLGLDFADAEERDGLYLIKQFYPPGVRPIFFSSDPALGLCQGHTVTYVAMQLAYYMGFSTVYLVGVDHRFAAGGESNKLVVANGADPDHFDPNYFGPGTEWQLPDLEASETAYRLAKYNFEKEGRRILDATVGGALQVFPKIDQSEIVVG